MLINEMHGHIFLLLHVVQFVPCVLIAFKSVWVGLGIAVVNVIVTPYKIQQVKKMTTNFP